MLYVYNTSADPAFNLALEEFLVKTSSEPYASQDIALLWQNRPTVVIGRNQNASHELNRTLVEERDIKVVRRLSGGGAVYHDEGNINFTVILRDGFKHKGDFCFFTEPLAAALASIGVKAEFSGRNDVEVAGAKFSGNAQYSFKNTLLHHGTILYNSDLSVLSSVLKPKKQTKVAVAAGQKPKGVSSVIRSVVNLSEHTDMSVHDFMNLFAHYLVGVKAQEDLPLVTLSLAECAEVEALAAEKYRTDAWTWGRSPVYTEVYEERFTSGNLMIALATHEGIITEFDIYGDFFEKEPLIQLCEKFKGAKRDEFLDILMTISVSDYLLNIGNEEFTHLINQDNRLK